MIAKNYFTELLKIKKQPTLWIGDIYKCVDGNIYKNMEISKIKEFDKKQFNELLVLEWAIFLFPNIKTYLKKALRNNTFCSFSETDNNMPDFMLNKEYYEVTSFIKIFDVKKGGTPGIDFERKIMMDSIKDSKLDFEDKTLVTYGNEDAKLHIDIAAIWRKKYKEAFEQIFNKSNKRYNFKEGSPLNILFWFDRNIIQTTFLHEFGLVEYVKNNCNNKLFKLIFSKIKNIYFVGEDRRTFPKEIRGDNPKYVARGIKFNKEHFEYIIKNKKIDKSKSYAALPTLEQFNIQEEILKKTQK